MAKYIIESDTLQGLADAIREVSGTTRSYTPTEMIEAVTTILENGAYVLVDDNGNEIPAVFVNNDEAFTATANDIRIGTTAVTEDGVTEGTKEIPSYHTTEGSKVIPVGSSFVLPMKNYDYTKMQAIFCLFNTSLTDSVSAEKVAINDNVYPVQSTEAEATITKDAEGATVNFGITNTGAVPCLIRYFAYKEIY